MDILNDLPATGPITLIAEFTAREFWTENYATKGGQEKSIAPNAMWTKRPRGQIAKCASAQALRIAFPEIASAPTADEMEGKQIHPDDVPPTAEAAAAPELIARAQAEADKGVTAYSAFWQSITKDERKSLGAQHGDLKASAERADAARTVDADAEGVGQ